MSKIKKIIITALCVALGIILPMAFHTVQNAGAVFCPMHIPIFLCAIICGWKYGIICGVLCPLLSSFITGMPPIGILPFLVVEFVTYGVVAGVMFEKLSTKKIYFDIYASLITAMLLGRIVNGIVKAVALSGEYTIGIWLTASFVTCIPGIVIQILLVPSIVMILMKSKLISNKYLANS